MSEKKEVNQKNLFSSSFRGFDKQEVITYIDDIITGHKQENNELKQDILNLKTKLNEVITAYNSIIKILEQYREAFEELKGMPQQDESATSCEQPSVFDVVLSKEADADTPDNETASCELETSQPLEQSSQQEAEQPQEQPVFEPQQEAEQPQEQPVFEPQQEAEQSQDQPVFVPQQEAEQSQQQPVFEPQQAAEQPQEQPVFEPQQEAEQPQQQSVMEEQSKVSQQYGKIPEVPVFTSVFETPFAPFAPQQTEQNNQSGLATDNTQQFGEQASAQQTPIVASPPVFNATSFNGGQSPEQPQQPAIAAFAPQQPTHVPPYVPQLPQNTQQQTEQTTGQPQQPTHVPPYVPAFPQNPNNNSGNNENAEAQLETKTVKAPQIPSFEQAFPSTGSVNQPTSVPGTNSAPVIPPYVPMYAGQQNAAPLQSTAPQPVAMPTFAPNNQQFNNGVPPQQWAPPAQNNQSVPLNTSEATGEWNK